MNTSVCRFLLLGLIWFYPQVLKAQAPDMSKMGRYTFVMLTTGPHRDQDSATVAGIQRGHLAHLDSMASMGLLDIAGPFLDKSDWRGLLIFNTSDTARVRNLVEQDPAVKAGRLSYRLHPWMAQRGSVLH